MVDNTFYWGGGFNNPQIKDIAIQSDGKVVV
jgi:hypothetical protein